MAHVQAAGAARSTIGMNTGIKGPSTTRTFALGEVVLDIQGNAWIYGLNDTGSTLAAGQIAASYAGAFTTGNGATIDKDVADNEYYWARLLDGGIGLAQDVLPTIALAAGGSNNTMTITVTWKDAAGNTVKGVRMFDIYLSDSSTGAGLTGTAISGEVVATTGSSLATVTTHKRWTVLSAATGVFVGTMTDTSETTGQYVVVSDPQTGKNYVSSVTAAGTWG